MLDYTDHVSFCTKLKNTLEEQKQWLEICHIQSENCHRVAWVWYFKFIAVLTCIRRHNWLDLPLGNARSLMHLCRLRIRRHLIQLRLRAPVFISFLPLPPRLKDYLQYKEFDVYSRGSMVNFQWKHIHGYQRCCCHRETVNMYYLFVFIKLVYMFCVDLQYLTELI